jgi:hypothetical protein
METNKQMVEIRNSNMNLLQINFGYVDKINDECKKEIIIDTVIGWLKRTGFEPVNVEYDVEIYKKSKWQSRTIEDLCQELRAKITILEKKL